MTIKDLAYFDRPYEKLFINGEESLSDSEVLAIIINTGTKNKTALDISKEMMTNDKENIGLKFLTQYSIEELMKMKGIGKKKAILIKAVCEFARRFNYDKPNPEERINTPEQLSRVFKLDLQDKKQEIIKTAILDSKNRVLKIITNSIGKDNCCMANLKDILSEPIKSCAPKIAIAHNHPSGDVTPSDSDIDFTLKLKDACNLLGIEFLDHIIIRKKFFL